MSLLVALAMAQSAQAQPPAAPPFDRAQHVASLDGAMAKADYNAIMELALQPKSAPEAMASLDWLGDRFKSGSSIAIAFTYSRLLAGLAAQLPEGQRDQLRGTALAAAIYAAAASAIEDRQCADRTARGTRIQQLSAQIASSGLLELDDPTRRLAAAIALDIERKTWEKRKTANEAAFLCMNGMSAMSAGISAGSVKEEASKPGQIGRQMSVKVPDDFVYERRPDSEWWPEAEKLREQLPQLVVSLARVDRLPTEAELATIGK